MEAKVITFAKGLFDTVQLSPDCCYSWTLTSRIGDMLNESEQLFGERDKSWTILGVEINVRGDTPQNWYPGGRKCKHIVFQLTGPSHLDEVNANYQLAHEVIHALSPVVGEFSNVMEEGVATWFARYYVFKNFKVPYYEGLQSYKNARELVEQLLTIDKEAVRKLRYIEPNFKRMTERVFRDAGIEAEDELIGKLLMPFSR